MNAKMIRIAVDVLETTMRVRCEAEPLVYDSELAAVPQRVFAHVGGSLVRSLIEQYEKARGRISLTARFMDCVSSALGLARPKSLNIIVTVKLATSGELGALISEVKADSESLGRLSRVAVAHAAKHMLENLFAAHIVLRKIESQTAPVPESETESSIRNQAKARAELYSSLRSRPSSN